ncbi:MAG: deoxyribodipyrimidine photolyase [Firmicutes bacterium ML8_F2]|nr:MAG: deoxyribodipyrimidine photolyase [Firmicutes bacterium ML8_F2]
MNGTVDGSRVRRLNEKPVAGGPVIYWMSRDQRVDDNWALLYAREMALEMKTPLAVIFCLVPEFLGAGQLHYHFMLEGLQELGKKLLGLNIGFYLLAGEPSVEILRLCRKLQAGTLVCDFSPLRICRSWKKAVSEKINIAFFEADAHNIIPCPLASPKQEYAAYTFRPKIKKLLPQFLTSFPRVTRHPHSPAQDDSTVSWAGARSFLRLSKKEKDILPFPPGEKAALAALNFFINEKLPHYEQKRNDPTAGGQSDLSPYLHFGQLSAQRLALAVQDAEEPGIRGDAFLEELIVRRELADNFCYYNEHYDSVEAFPRWAKETLEIHAADRREYIYSLQEFTEARTHDPLWNAAQKEMLLKGKMHGYLRMYWAKKILEWTEDPARAIQIAITLNDGYSLDGRDPNGYAGIAWSIGGVHDRAWFERPIFGKIRYMSYNGSKSKFNVDAYISRINNLEDGSNITS